MTNDEYEAIQNRPFDIVDALAEMFGHAPRKKAKKAEPHEPSDIPEWMRGEQMEMD